MHVHVHAHVEHEGEEEAHLTLIHSTPTPTPTPPLNSPLNSPLSPTPTPTPIRHMPTSPSAAACSLSVGTATRMTPLCASRRRYTDAAVTNSAKTAEGAATATTRLIGGWGWVGLGLGLGLGWVKVRRERG